MNWFNNANRDIAELPIERPWIGFGLLLASFALILVVAASPQAAFADDPSENGVPRPAEEHPYGFGEWWLFGGQTTGVAQVSTRMKSPYDNPTIS